MKIKDLLNPKTRDIFDLCDYAKKSISEASEKLLLDIKTDSKTCKAIVGILTADYSPGLPDEIQWKIAVYRYMQKTYGTDFMDCRIAEAIKEEKIIKENM